MDSYPKLRLIYFPVRARAEGAKLIMAYGNIPFEEVQDQVIFEIYVLKHFFFIYKSN